MTASEQDNHPFAEVILSRSSYRVGESVVGTIRLVAPPSVTLSPREVFFDTYVFVAGWCRLDPRWHRASEYAKKYESPAVHFNLQNRRDSNSNVVIDENCVCFWTTNVLNLSGLQERTIGKWEDVKPKPIRSSQVTPTPTGEQKNDGSINSTLQNEQVPKLENQQLTFTFRAELPSNLPHSVRANSCRYFYAVMVGTRVRIPHSRKQWLRHGTPLHILSLRPDQPVPPQEQSTHPTVYPVGSCTAMAHSAGLPCHVSATELHQPTGQILVNRRGTSSLGSLIARRNQDGNLQSMRITDLQGIPCCVLTVMGVATASPGSRMVLKFDFPRRQRGQVWTPCYQVSASLEGEEVACYLDGTRKRAQAYQFDTAHAVVDPACTERLCLSLLVPLDAPNTLQTDLVQVSVKCTIDITVGTHKPVKFSNLRLELPCRIVQSLSEYEIVLSEEDEEQDEDDAYLKLPLDELILGPSYRSTDGGYYSDDPPLVETVALRSTQDSTHPNSFRTKDIRQDLKILSLRMANECNLVER